MILRIIVFYVLALIFTILLGAIQQALGINALLTALPQWGPGIAGLLMLLLFRKDDLKLNFKLVRVSSNKILAAFLLPLVPSVLIFPTVWITQKDFSLPTSLPPLLFLAASLALGAIGEEIGWRGYLQVRLNWQLNPFVAASIVGALWGLWHFGFYQNGPLFMLLAIIAFIAISVTMSTVLQDIDYNLWIASLFHYGISVTSLIYLSVINQANFMLLYAAAWVALAFLTVFWSQRKTKRAAQKIQLD